MMVKLKQSVGQKVKNAMCPTQFSAECPKGEV